MNEHEGKHTTRRQGDDRWQYITEPEPLISVAAQQGTTISADEAAAILGYMEGHDYSLMTDGSGKMVRHDNQSGDGHDENQLYSFLDAAMFCSGMNEELLREPTHLATRTYEAYVSSLHEDERILDGLLEKFLNGGEII